MRVCPYLFTFRVYPDNDTTLSAVGLYSLFGHFCPCQDEYTPIALSRACKNMKTTTPSTRVTRQVDFGLAFQYRRLDNHDGKTTSPEWCWATAPRALARAKAFA